jgi:hypothetical protein
MWGDEEVIIKIQNGNLDKMLLLSKLDLNKNSKRFG